MRIGLVAPPWVSVPPVRYGGTEQVVDDLARALTRLGHDVRLFTIGESTCPVPRGWYFEKAVDAIGTTVPESAHVLAAYRDLADVDVIHDHTILGPLVAGRLSGLPPVVATNHGPYTAADLPRPPEVDEPLTLSTKPRTRNKTVGVGPDALLRTVLS